MDNTRSGESVATVSQLTTAQVAARLRRSVRTVHRMADTGQLAATRVPGYKGPLLFDPEEVERVRLELASDAPPTPAAAPGPTPARARAS